MEGAMTFREVVEARYSVREFDGSAELPDEVLERMLEAAVKAPTAGNCQAWHLWVVRDPAVRQGLAEAAAQPFVAETPVVVVVCVEPERSGERYGQRGRELYCYQDAANAASHLLLAAVDGGGAGSRSAAPAGGPAAPRQAGRRAHVPFAPAAPRRGGDEAVGRAMARAIDAWAHLRGATRRAQQRAQQRPLDGGDGGSSQPFSARPRSTLSLSWNQAPSAPSSDSHSKPNPVAAAPQTAWPK
jgi:nitroreductase